MRNFFDPDFSISAAFIPLVIPPRPPEFGGEDRLENPGNDISDTVSSRDTTTLP